MLRFECALNFEDLAQIYDSKPFHSVEHFSESVDFKCKFEREFFTYKVYLNRDLGKTQNLVGFLHFVR